MKARSQLPAIPSIDRRFLGWDRPLLVSAAEHLVDHYQVGDVVDMRDAAIAAPTRRGQRRLKERLLVECERREARLVPPEMLGIGDLPELYYRARLTPASPLARRRTWAAALRGLPVADLERIVGEPPAPNDERGWDALGGAIAQLQLQVGAGGYRFEEVAEVCRSTVELLADDSDRWDILARVQIDFERRLEALGFSDPALERLTALLGELRDPGRDLWLLGVAELPGIAAAFVRAAPRRVFALIHAPSEEAESFDDLGRIDPHAWAGRTIPLQDVQLRIAPDPAGQAATVLDALGDLGEIAPDEVVVGMPDDSLRSYVEERLHDAGVSTHFAAGTGMEQSPAYRLLEAVAAYLEGGAWHDFAALLRHPDIERRLGPRPIEDADDYFGRRLPQRIATHGRTAAAIRADGGWGEGLEQLLRPLRGERALAEWPLPITDLLVAVYGGRRLDPDRPEDDAAIRVLRQIREAAASIRGLPPELSCHCSAPLAIRSILDEIRSNAVADDPEISTVDLLGWLELPLDDSPHVIITGANEPALPESVNAHPFLPDALRRRLGISDNAHRYARDLFHLTGLLASRRTVRIIAGRVDGEGNPLRPSRLLLTPRGEALARRVREFAADGKVDEGRPSPLEARARTSSAFRLPPHPVLHFEPPERIRVTDFRRYLDDPYRVVLERIIGSVPADDSARELDPLGFGHLAHEVLANFSRGATGSSADPDLVRKSLDKLLDAEAARRFGDHAYPSVYLQIEQLRGRLHRFAAWQAEWVEAGWRTVIVEGTPVEVKEDARTLETPFEVDGVEIIIAGRIDRVDHHAGQDRWAILDYKTSDEHKSPEVVHRTKRDRRWVDLQLPLYRCLVPGLRKVDGSRLIPEGIDPELGFILLSRDLGASCCEIADWGPDDLEEANEVARNIVRELRGGEVAFNGTLPGYPDDPMAALLGARQLAAAQAEDIAEGAAEEDG